MLHGQGQGVLSQAKQQALADLAHSDRLFIAALRRIVNSLPATGGWRAFLSIHVR